YNLLQSIDLLINAANHLAEKCLDADRFLSGQNVDGVVRLEADEERCRELVEKSLAMCTALAPRIGYDNAAAIAKAAYRDGKTIRETARELVGQEVDQVEACLGPPASSKVLAGHGGYPSREEIERLLDPWEQTVRGTGVQEGAGR